MYYVLQTGEDAHLVNSEQSVHALTEHDQLTVVLPIMKGAQFDAHPLRSCYDQTGEMEEGNQPPAGRLQVW
jgi:hypothetical protein